MSFDEILAAGNAYCKDDRIELEVDVRTDAAFGVRSSSSFWTIATTYDGRA